MRTQGNTILITGGASGIGLAFAERFLKAGNEVIICGRRAEKLEEAKARFPELHTRVIDVSNPDERIALFTWATAEFPNLNVLVNNAGIQQRFNMTTGAAEWRYYHQELATNLDAPVHLSTLFVPHFLKRDHAAFINVSSGLALAPAAWAPIYSATKAAIRSFSRSMRLQLSGTNVDIIEVLPPAVNTDLGGAGLHTFGVPLDAFADAIFEGFANGEVEIGYGGTEKRLYATKEESDVAAQQMWENFVKNNPQF